MKTTTKILLTVLMLVATATNSAFADEHSPLGNAESCVEIEPLSVGTFRFLRFFNDCDEAIMVRYRLTDGRIRQVGSFGYISGNGHADESMPPQGKIDHWGACYSPQEPVVKRKALAYRCK